MNDSISDSIVGHLQQEIQDLRKKLNEEVESFQKKVLSLSEENLFLKKITSGEMIPVKKGDVFLISEQDYLSENATFLMNLAKEHHCTFVSLPKNGLEILTKLSNPELKAHGLQKVEKAETESEKLHEILLELQDLREEAKRNQDSPEVYSKVMNLLYDKLTRSTSQV